MTADPSLPAGSPSPAPLLDVRGLDVHFDSHRGAHHAVRNLDFQLAQGQTLALVGESGCGKSTTALSILRLLGPEARITGQVRLQDTDILALPPRELRALRGRDVSMIFQEPMTSLNPVHTVGAQIIETLRLHQGLSRQAARARTLEMLELVGIPEPARRIDDYPHHLSGGQRQRVMIATAVACQPRLLIADEPTTALDVTVQARILELLDRLRRDLSMGLLLITHDLGVVSQWADRVLVMFDGQCVEEGAAGEVFAHPRHAYARGLLGASLHAGKEAHYTAGLLPEIHRVVDPATGERGFELVTPARGSRQTPDEPAWRRGHAVVRDASRMPAPGDAAVQGRLGRDAASTPPILLSVQGLRTSYARRDGGMFHAVDDVSFEITRGESLGLVGESGCGKSSLSRTLMRLIPASGGRILFDGVDIAALSERQFKPWRPRIQMVFQDPFASLNPRRNVHDALDAVLSLHGEKDRARRRQRIAQVLDRVGLPASAAARFPHEFSGGQRQRIGIARALIVRPDLLILDEPVSALDVSIQAQILNLLVELKQEFGLSYLFISHDLSVVRYIADRVMVMHGGRIVEEGSHDRIWHAPRHAYTRTLIAAVPRPLPDAGSAGAVRQAA